MASLKLSYTVNPLRVPSHRPMLPDTMTGFPYQSLFSSVIAGVKPGVWPSNQPISASVSSS